MEIKRTASATWQGTGKEGIGTTTTQSTVLNKTQFSFGTRFADGIGTNPEELIAAAHAQCFSMKLAFLLQAAELVAEDIVTNCTIVLDNGVVTESQISTNIKAANLTQEKMEAIVKDAEENCLIGKLFNCKKTVVATLG